MDPYSLRDRKTSVEEGTLSYFFKTQAPEREILLKVCVRYFIFPLSPAVSALFNLLENSLFLLFDPHY